MAAWTLSKRTAGLVLMLLAALAAGPKAASAAIQISTSGQPNDFDVDAVQPVLTSDPVSRRVLAVWQVRSSRSPLASVTVARVLDDTGRPLGAQFVLGGPSQAAGQYDVASRPRAGGWIVVAVRADRQPASSLLAPRVPVHTSSQIVSFVVAASGAVGPRHAISAIARFSTPAPGGPHGVLSSGRNVSHPSIALDPHTGRGIVGWYQGATEVGGSGPRARGIDAAGRARTPVRTLATAPRNAAYSSGDVDVGYSARTRRWLAVWHQVVGLRSPLGRAAETLSARRILSSGRPRGPVHSLVAASFLADPDGDLGALGGPALVIDAASSGPLVLFSRGFVSGSAARLLVVRLGADGAALSRRPQTVATNARPLVPVDPHVLRDPASKRLVVVFTEACQPVPKEDCTPQRVLAQSLRATGQPLGATKTLVAGVLDDHSGPAVTSAGTVLLARATTVLTGEPIVSSEGFGTLVPAKTEILVDTAML